MSKTRGKLPLSPHLQPLFSFGATLRVKQNDECPKTAVLCRKGKEWKRAARKSSKMEKVCSDLHMGWAALRGGRRM